MTITIQRGKMPSKGLSLSKISELCSVLSPIASDLHSRGDEIQFNIDAAQRLLACFNAGHPDVMPELSTVTDRLQSLLETAVSDA